MSIRILWVCNVAIPKIAEAMGEQAPFICGWLNGYANELEKNTEIDLHICFPKLGIRKMLSGIAGNISYYAFSQPKVFGFLPAEDQVNASPLMIEHINEIMRIVKPDVLHLFGTEYPHSFVATKAFHNPRRTAVSIQGLTSVCYQHYNLGIPYDVCRSFAVSNIVRGNLLQQARRMKKRGETEVQTIQYANHIIGRTDWDKECTEEINPNARYHFCNESLRDAFYQGAWNPIECERHSIFMSQSSAPYKGLHLMLRAMPEILRVYPQARLYVAGNDLTMNSTLKHKLKKSSYAGYVLKLIRENGLKGKVLFTGILSECAMKERFLKSNVFVSASAIENSPNSLGEAMLLGLPCVTSDVGGVKNLIEHNKEGYVYQSDASYMIACYVKKVFADEASAEKMGISAHAHAAQTHNRSENIAALLSIYKEIHEGEESV